MSKIDISDNKELIQKIIKSAAQVDLIVSDHDNAKLVITFSKDLVPDIEAIGNKDFVPNPAPSSMNDMINMPAVHFASLSISKKAEVFCQAVNKKK